MANKVEWPQLTIDRRHLPSTVTVKAKTGDMNTREYEVTIIEKDNKIRVNLRRISFGGRAVETTEWVELSV